MTVAVEVRRPDSGGDHALDLCRVLRLGLRERNPTEQERTHDRAQRFQLSARVDEIGDVAGRQHRLFVVQHHVHADAQPRSRFRAFDGIRERGTGRHQARARHDAFVVRLEDRAVDARRETEIVRVDDQVRNARIEAREHAPFILRDARYALRRG
jgi:hypothetical protein